MEERAAHNTWHTGLHTLWHQNLYFCYIWLKGQLNILLDYYSKYNIHSDRKKINVLESSQVNLHLHRNQGNTTFSSIQYNFWNDLSASTSFIISFNKVIWYEYHGRIECHVNLKSTIGNCPWVGRRDILWYFSVVSIQPTLIFIHGYCYDNRYEAYI